jgi:2,4-dichlorophenol 6-monooxygenase
MMEQLETGVLVVGAGPAGLTATALLAKLGVLSLTVTKHGTSNSPRAHITNQRAVEILRELGLEERVQARALPHHLMGKQVFATAFAGRELSRMMAFGTGDDRIGEYRAASPTDMCNVPQHILEPILLDHCQQVGADVRLHHEAMSIRDDKGWVTTVIRPRRGGPVFAVRSKYVIGCDGARTVVGREGGFDYEGGAGLGNAVTVWIEADLAKYTAHRPGALFVVCEPGGDDIVSIWTCIEPWNEWSTIFVHHGMEAQNLSESTVLSRVRAAVGDPDVEVRIKHISPWEFNRVVATSYRHGRVFIAGDAAHRHPPANGLGSNTSMQDAWNLVWKLALVLQGKAGDRLLDSYSAERQPVGRQVVDRANQSVGEMAAWLVPLGLHPGFDRDAALAHLDEVFGPDGEVTRGELLKGLEVMNAQFNAHGVELNQRYESLAVVGDGTPFPAFERDPDLYYQATTHPGAPLPHAWLGRDTHDISTFDLGSYDGFALITGADTSVWDLAAKRVAAELDVRIEVYGVALGQAYNDVLGEWTRRREVTEQGCVLVRPDRVVGWRSHDLPPDPNGALLAAVAQILDRREAGPLFEPARSTSDLKGSR